MPCSVFHGGDYVITKIVYCISDVGNMVDVLLKSLKTLNRFVQKDIVEVILTPPIYPKTEKRIEPYARCRISDNYTEPFSMNIENSARYGEKLQFVFTESENCIFLDHDTTIHRNITELLEDDYDVAFRQNPNMDTMYNPNKWRNYFEKYKKSVIPMCNSGFIIFKNGSHKKIQKEVFEIFNDPNMIEGSSVVNPVYSRCQHRDQIALSVACADMKIRWLNPIEHTLRWNFDLNGRYIPYVIHGTKDGIKKPLARFASRTKRWWFCISS